jgi:hypothetical protein
MTYTMRVLLDKQMRNKSQRFSVCFYNESEELVMSVKGFRLSPDHTAISPPATEFKGYMYPVVDLVGEFGKKIIKAVREQMKDNEDE